MPGTAAKVILTERQQEILLDIVHSRCSPQGLVQRARTILLAFDGLQNEQIALKLDYNRRGVGMWRKRWQQSFEELTVIECTQTPVDLRRAIQNVLSDLPRPGCPGKFTAEQITLILATACEPPSQSNRPVSHWTPRELADEVIKRNIVPSISVRQIGRFLKDGGIKTSPKPLLA